VEQAADGALQPDRLVAGHRRAEAGLGPQA
jgi:hypothetical protein